MTWPAFEGVDEHTDVLNHISCPQDEGTISCLDPRRATRKYKYQRGDNKSGYPGVAWVGSRGSWGAFYYSIRDGKKNRHAKWFNPAKFNNNKEKAREQAVSFKMNKDKEYDRQKRNWPEACPKGASGITWNCRGAAEAGLVWPTDSATICYSPNDSYGSAAASSIPWNYTSAAEAGHGWPNDSTSQCYSPKESFRGVDIPLKMEATLDYGLHVGVTGDQPNFCYSPGESYRTGEITQMEAALNHGIQHVGTARNLKHWQAPPVAAMQYMHSVGTHDY